MATMVNFMRMEWVMTTTPKKNICCINTRANVKLLAKRLQLFGNQDFVETFTYKMVNNPTMEMVTLPITDYEIGEHHCYIKFEGNIGVVEILGEEPQE